MLLSTISLTKVSNSQLQIFKVLLEGLYDPDSNLSMLRMPVVGSPLMKMIWDKVTEDWQVFLVPNNI